MTGVPERFAFSPIDWQLTDACETYFFLQGTADRLNTAMDAAVLASKHGASPKQLVADLRATAAAVDPYAGALEPPTRDMLLQLLSRISGTAQHTLLGYWLAAGRRA